MTMLDSPNLARPTDDDRRLLEPFQAELQDLRTNDASRLNRMDEARKLVASFRRDLGGHAVPSDYGRNPVPQPGTQRLDIRLPYLLATTVKHTHRTAGVLPDVHVDRADSGAAERWRQSVLERFLAVCYEHSDAELQVNAAAWDASVTGAGAFEVAWKHDKQVGCYYARDPGGIVVVPDPYTVWPYVRAYRSWLSPLASVKAGYRSTPINPMNVTLGVPNVEGLIPVDGSDSITGEMVQINQMHDATQCIRWSGDVLLHQSDHGAGACPVVVFPNLGPQRIVYGYSDVEMCQDIALYYQWLFSRQADVVAFAARGAYMEEQTGVPAAQVADVIRKGGVIPIRRDGKIEPIQAADQPPFVNEHLDAARTSLNDLSFTPEAAWGGTANSATSGSERGMQLQPQVELAREKQVNLGWALEKVNELLLRMAEKQALATTSYRGRQKRDGVTRSFAMQLGPTASQPTGYQPGPGEELETRLPKLINGDYATDVVFTDHLDVWDPQYVLSELNKFGQAAQSLRTTLERLGCADPDEEIKLIQSEAEEMPWIRQGMIALVEQQLNAQDQGAEAGGAQALDQGGGGPAAGLDTLGQPGGAPLGGDALTRALNGAADAPGGRKPGAPAGQIGGAPPGGGY